MVAAGHDLPNLGSVELAIEKWPVDEAPKIAVAAHQPLVNGVAFMRDRDFPELLHPRGGLERFHEVVGLDHLAVAQP